MDIEQDTTTADSQSTETQSTGEQDPLAYEKGISLSDKLDKNPNSLQQILELDKLEKFKWEGKEYTPAQLKKMAMQEADYTKKTQQIAAERKSFQETEKYNTNLYHDLQKIKANPSLVDEFKKIYPEKYHQYVDLIAANATMNKETNPASQTQSAQAEFKDPRVDEVFDWVSEQKLQTAVVQVNATFDKLTAQYPDASEREVIGQAQHLLALHKQNPQEYKKPDEKTIEELFKASQEDRLGFAKGYQSRLIKSQQAANAKGTGPGAGGGTPGGAPKVARTLKEASALALQDPGFT